MEYRTYSQGNHVTDFVTPQEKTLSRMTVIGELYYLYYKHLLYTDSKLKS